MTMILSGDLILSFAAKKGDITPSSLLLLLDWAMTLPLYSSFSRMSSSSAIISNCCRANDTSSSDVTSRGMSMGGEDDLPR